MCQILSKGVEMHIEQVIILHEYGAPSHYRALQYLLNQNNRGLQFYEFSILKTLMKSIVKMDFKLFKKQVQNIYNLFNLMFTKNKKIILGIAPYDYRLNIMNYVLRNHEVYYHTSWTHWDEVFYPKKLFYSKKLLKKWEFFLNNKVEQIFAATHFTKESLILNKKVYPSKISVVYHSFDDNIYYPDATYQAGSQIRLLYVGRLTESKGVKKIIDFFDQNNKIGFLTFVGSGNLQAEVKKLAAEHKNVTYEGYINEQNKLADIYRKADYLLLPSIKQNNWEELFGMVMIEAMACGVVPIASNHIGPAEVINHGENGFLMKEDEFEATLSKLIAQHNYKKYMDLKSSAIKMSKNYTIKNISSRWYPILREK